MERLLGESSSGAQVAAGGEVWELDGDLEAMGLVTELYGYQRVSVEIDSTGMLSLVSDSCFTKQRSVAQMLLQESNPTLYRDIKFVEMKEMGRDETYFVNLQNGEIRREEDVGYYELPRGGIL